MDWTRVIVGTVLIVAGVGLLLLLPGIDGKIAEVESLLADADEVLATHQARARYIPGHPDEVETEIQIHRMSYLAVLEEKQFQRTSALVCGPSLIVLGLGVLIRLGWATLSKGTQGKRVRRKRRKRRRKSPPRSRPSAGRPRNRRSP